MGTLEINDQEIDVEEIMCKIRKKIAEKRVAGSAQGTTLIDNSDMTRGLHRDIRYLNSNWDIRNNSYFVSSHRPVIGTVLKKGRMLVHGEVRRYVDPIIFKQNEFNSSTSGLLSAVLRRLDQIDLKLDALQVQVDASNKAQSLAEVRGEVSTIKDETNVIRSKVSRAPPGT